MKRILLYFLLAFTTCTAHAGFDIDQLMATLAQEARNPAGLRAHFVETRHMALLDAPLRSSGEMRFTPPDRLEKDTRAPRPETLVLEKNTLTIERDGRSMTWHLGSRPEAIAFIESIRSTLSGRQDVLRKLYRLSLQGDPQAWTLELQPTSSDVQALVTRITISGTQGQVQHIAYQQADGDSTELAITPIAE